METKKGTKYDVTPAMDTSVKLDSKIPCAVCQKLFSGKQYLDMHIHFKHADTLSSGTANAQDFTPSMAIDLVLIKEWRGCLDLM